MVFAAVVVVLALAQGLQGAVVTRDLSNINTLPLLINGGLIQTLPAFIEPEIEAVPLPSPEVEPEIEAVPLPAPEVEAVVTNPCEACFEYMTALIEQLTDVAVPEIEAHPMPVAPEVEVEDDPIFSILPHPMPTVEVVAPEEESVPEFEIFPHPMPTVEVVGA